MRTTAIIVAAGEGRRMQNTVSKPFIKIGKKSIIEITLSAFEKSTLISEIILVVSKKDLPKAKRLKFTKIKAILAGGKERQDSVWEGLTQISKDAELVLIHDGVRPFISQKVIRQIIAEAKVYKAVVAGVPVKDTIKRITKDNFIQCTPEREKLWIAQTPQAFSARLILAAYQQAQKDKIYATDDAKLAEMLGSKIKMIRGSYVNIKITTPEDLVTAESILKKWKI